MSVSETSKSPWGPTRRRRGSKYPVKREAVLNAAAALMRRNGYDAMSLNDLADILNITKPTLYYYVGSKEALYGEIIDRSQTETLEFMHGVVASEMSGYAKLEAIMKTYVEHTNSDFGACLMLVMPANIDRTLGRKIQARTREANELIYQVLEEGKKDGTLRVDDPTVVLHALFGSLNWIPRWYKPAGRHSLKKIAELQVEVLLNGIRGPALAAEPGPPARTSRRKG
jgi:AcrR family transcriptional regulator